MIERNLSDLNEIHIHHSASSNPEHDYVEIIREWHLKRGWEDVGYNFIIRSNGEVQAGRDIKYQPASILNRNDYAIAICLLGHSAFTGKQYISLYRLLEFLIQKYEINPDNIYRHCDLAKTDCPGMELSRVFVQEMKKKYNY